MGSDLAALTPPFLVCVAFLIAVGAFLRHEMRRGKSPIDDDDSLDDDDGSEISAKCSPRPAGENRRDPGADARHEDVADRRDTGPTTR
jgi:hypothetical protein